MVDDALKDVAEIYESGLNSRTTEEILVLLKDVRGADAVEARKLTYDAIVRLCDYINVWNPKSQIPLEDIESEIDAALEDNRDLAPAHYAKGFLHRTRGEHEAALAEFTQTTILEPGFYRAYAQKGAELLYLGFPEQAFPEVRKAIARSRGAMPRGMFFWILARIYFFSGRYEEAIPWLQLSVELREDLWYNRLYLVSAYAIIGELELARAELTKFRSVPKAIGAEFAFSDYTIDTVIENEKRTPNEHTFVRQGREKFHIGLRIAGL